MKITQVWVKQTCDDHDGIYTRPCSLCGNTVNGVWEQWVSLKELHSQLLEMDDDGNCTARRTR